MSNNNVRNYRNYFFIDFSWNRKSIVKAYKLLSIGGIRNSYVWKEGMADWMHVKKIPEMRTSILKCFNDVTECERLFKKNVL